MACPALTNICRPMLKSTDSRSLLALAKALLSLKRENNYLELRIFFRDALLKSLKEEVLPKYEEEDKAMEEKDLQLMNFAFQEKNRDRCFLALAENLKVPLWVFEGKVIQSRERGMSFEEDYARIYRWTGATMDFGQITVTGTVSQQSPVCLR